jgi:hypothetical protein
MISEFPRFAAAIGADPKGCGSQCEIADSLTPEGRRPKIGVNT